MMKSTVGQVERHLKGQAGKWVDEKRGWNSRNQFLAKLGGGGSFHTTTSASEKWVMKYIYDKLTLHLIIFLRNLPFLSGQKLKAVSFPPIISIRLELFPKKL